ncbi:MAG: arylsulfatase [Armatimonadota bacterium]|nr:MAG: arylsulfatase [Armatimonadota bacterium]
MENTPNILLFTTDQHRGDYIGLAGHPVVETPNLDAFIQRGAYFPNAYSEIPSTTGARRCLHGGQGSYACGLIGYAGVEWHERNTLAQVLADAGYHCMSVGFRNMHPRRKLYGFHTAIPHDLSEEADDYAEWLRRELGPWATERGHGCDANGWLARPWHLEERYHPTTWTTDVVLEQLRKRDPTKPFFLWCSHLRPHSPYDPPRFFWEMYIEREFPPIPIGDWAAKHDVAAPPERAAWRGKLTPEQNQRMRAAYAGVITHIDYELGRLLETVQRYIGGEMAQNTLIIFTSDHGDMMGDHNLHRKTYAYEGSARVPFVIRYPQGMDLPAGRFEHVVGLQDVMPTILEAVGVPIPGSVTGMSVFRAIRGGAWREFLHGEHSPCYSVEEAMQYLTDGKEKYLWVPATGEEQFFDLSKDRRELHDLSRSGAHRERVAMWRERLIRLLGERGDGFSDGKRLIRRTERWSPVVGEEQ